MRRYRVTAAVQLNDARIVVDYPSLNDILVEEDGKLYIEAPDLDVAIEWLLDRALYDTPFEKTPCVVVKVGDEGTEIELYDRERE